MIKRMKDRTGRTRTVDYDYINSYAAENYDRITIIVPKGTKGRIKECAVANGKSLSDFIVSCLPDELIGAWKAKE